MTTVLNKAARTRVPLPEGFRVDRRRFLKGGATAIGAYAVMVSGATWLVGPNKAWAVTYDVFDPEIAQRLYRYVYSGGNMRDWTETYVGFRGREPSVEPLLRNRGFLEEDSE